MPGNQSATVTQGATIRQTRLSMMKCLSDLTARRA